MLLIPPFCKWRNPYNFTYDLPKSYASWIPSLTQDFLFTAGVPPTLTYAILCLSSLSPWRETMWEENTLEGRFVSSMLCGPELSTLSHWSLLGHRKDLQSGFLWVKQFCVIPRRPWEHEAIFVPAKVCFPSRNRLESSGWLLSFDL